MVANSSAAAKLPGARVVKPGDRLTVAGVEIEAVPAYNVTKFRSPGVPFHPRDAAHVGYVVTVGGVRLYFAGDTDQIPEMADIACDVALLPVSGIYVMTAEEAAEAARTIKPQIAVPMHYGAGIGDRERWPAFRRPVRRAGDHPPGRVIAVAWALAEPAAGGIISQARHRSWRYPGLASWRAVRAAYPASRNLPCPGRAGSPAAGRQRQPQNLNHQSSLFPLGLGTALSLMGDATLYAVLPTHTAEAGIPLASVGILLGVNRAVRLLTNGPAGLAYDRWPRRWLFVPALFVGALSTALYAATRGFWPLLAGRLLWGLAWSGIWVGGATVILDVTTGQGPRASDRAVPNLVLPGRRVRRSGRRGAHRPGRLHRYDVDRRRPDGAGRPGSLDLAAGDARDAPDTTSALRPIGNGPRLLANRRLWLAASLQAVNRFVTAGVLWRPWGCWCRIGLRSAGALLGVATLTGLLLAGRTSLSMLAAPSSGIASDRLGSRWRVCAWTLAIGAAGMALVDPAHSGRDPGRHRPGAVASGGDTDPDHGAHRRPGQPGAAGAGHRPVADYRRPGQRPRAAGGICPATLGEAAGRVLAVCGPVCFAVAGGAVVPVSTDAGSMAISPR